MDAENLEDDYDEEEGEDNRAADAAMPGRASAPDTQPARSGRDQESECSEASNEEET